MPPQAAASPRPSISARASPRSRELVIARQNIPAGRSTYVLPMRYRAQMLIDAGLIDEAERAPGT